MVIYNLSQNDDVFKGFGVEVTMPDQEAFLKVRETLERIGHAKTEEKKLFQLCHLLHCRGHYAIMHWKEIRALDDQPVPITEDDIKRRNTVTSLLTQWGLVRPIIKLEEVPRATMATIKVLPYEEKQNWHLVQRVVVGKKKPRPATRYLRASDDVG